MADSRSFAIKYATVTILGVIVATLFEVHGGSAADFEVGLTMSLPQSGV